MKLDVTLFAVVTVSPNKQYLGILSPTTPETTDPVCAPLIKYQFFTKLRLKHDNELITNTNLHWIAICWISHCIYQCQHINCHR